MKSLVSPNPWLSSFGFNLMILGTWSGSTNELAPSETTFVSSPQSSPISNLLQVFLVSFLSFVFFLLFLLQPFFTSLLPVLLSVQLSFLSFLFLFFRFQQQNSAFSLPIATCFFPCSAVGQNARISCVLAFHFLSSKRCRFDQNKPWPWICSGLSIWFGPGFVLCVLIGLTWFNWICV